MGLKGKSFTGIVLARGDSKGIKLKNLQLLAGKPLLWYILKAAKDSEIFDQLYVSSDHPDILQTALDYGIKIIDRPPELASDTATSEDAMAHALSQVNKTDYVVLLEPTHPLLSGEQLKAAAEMLIKSGKDAILSVVESPTGYCSPLGKNSSLKDFVPVNLRKKRRQDVGVTYYIGGGIYVTKWDILAVAGDFFACDSIAYVMPYKFQDIDINTREDLQMAEVWLKRNNPIRPSRLRAIWRVLCKILLG